MRAARWRSDVGAATSRWQGELQAERVGAEAAELRAQLGTLLGVRGIVGEIRHLVRIGLQIVELGDVAVRPADVLVPLGAHGTVAHADQPRPGAFAVVLDEERSPPGLPGAVE